MAIPLDKILNLSIDLYVRNQSRILADYTLIGVHCDKPRIDEFARLVPDNAEVVVNYEWRSHTSGGTINQDHFYQGGVALIRKEEKPAQ